MSDTKTEKVSLPVISTSTSTSTGSAKLEAASIDTVFWCDKLSAKITVATCLKRQAARQPTKLGRKAPPVFDMCAQGDDIPRSPRCNQGVEIADAVGEVIRPKTASRWVHVYDKGF